MSQKRSWREFVRTLFVVGQAAIEYIKFARNTLGFIVATLQANKLIVKRFGRQLLAAF
jgi:hypothetical protein